MRIILTGGGTGGHVIPNVAVIEELRKKGEHELLYIGSAEGPEKGILERSGTFENGLDFRNIECGKLRRYFSWQNISDIFKVIRGVRQAKKIIKEWKPDVIFSKGGFVTLPVVMAAHKTGVRLIVHESDISPGISTKVGMKVADVICLSFPESKKFVKNKKAQVVVTGNPVRESISRGNAEFAYKFTKLNKHRPIILVMGGSQGARQINQLVRRSLDELLKKYQIVHLTGRGNLDIGIKREGYAQFEYLDEQMRDIYAISEMVITRGGANSLAELAYLKKKAIVIPLSGAASRGDQVENAHLYAQKYGWSVLDGEIGKADFEKALELAFHNDSVSGVEFENGVQEIVDLILEK